MDRKVERQDAARELYGMDDPALSRELWQSFLAIAPAAVALFDRDMRYLQASERWKRDYGLVDVDLIGRSHYDLFPEIPERWKEIHRRCLEGATERCDSDPFHRSDGHTDWIRWEVRPWRRQDGAIGGLVFFAEIITEAVEALQSLQASEARFRALVDQAPDAILVYDPAQDRLVEANPRAVELYGRERDELLTGSPRRFLAETQPDGRSLEHAYGEYVGAVSEGQVLRFERNIRHARGDIRVCEATMSPLPTTSGTLVRVSLVDVTERRKLEQALRASEARCSAIVEATPDAVVVIDHDRRVLFVNASVRRLFGYDQEELLGKTIGVLAPALPELELPAPETAGNPALLDPTHHASFESRVRRRDGREVPVEISLAALVIDGAPQLTLVIRDNSLRVAARLQMERLQRMRDVLSAVNQLIVRCRNKDELFDSTCRISVRQGRFKLAVILREEGGIGVPVAQCGDTTGYVPTLEASLPVPLDVGQLEPALRALRCRQAVICNNTAAEPGRWSVQARSRGLRSIAALPFDAGNWERFCIAFYSGEAGSFNDDEVRLLTEVAQDISFALEFMQREEKLEYLAYFDTLTQLPNRVHLLQSLERSIERARAQGQGLALMKIDIHNFRAINNAFGRAGGDEVLRVVAGRLLRYAGHRDRVARTGVDRFALILEGDVSVGHITEVVDLELKTLLAEPVVVSDQPVGLHFRVGVGRYPEDSDEPETLAQATETALRGAKSAGESICFYDERMGSGAARRLSIESRLLVAVERGEFALHYQPKVELQRNRIVGAEALLRWNCPDLGPVSPATFIPMLEENGLIVGVGKWALEQARRDFLTWRNDRLPAVPIAVNVSAVQLRRTDFVELLKLASGSGSAEPIGLEIEITESMLMSDINDNVTRLRALREIGVSVSIDDFGTGYSSLAYLARLPITALKIDRSFVASMNESPETMSVVTSILSLAHSLKLKVVAEGVETAEQLQILRLLRCDEIQGWIFSKAVPAAEFAQLLREDRRLSA